MSQLHCVLFFLFESVPFKIQEVVGFCMAKFWRQAHVIDLFQHLLSKPRQLARIFVGYDQDEHCAQPRTELLPPARSPAEPKPARVVRFFQSNRSVNRSPSCDQVWNIQICFDVPKLGTNLLTNHVPSYGGFVCSKIFKRGKSLANNSIILIQK